MSLPQSTWRLLKTAPASGAWNMAVDEAILEAVGQEAALPTLRLYAWAPACLSLGYAQPLADVDQARMAARGWEIVRRPTGGRAILHTDELTYSVIGPADEPRLEGDILSSYRRLSEALVAALQRLDLAVQAGPKSSGEAGQSLEPVCFEIPSNYEVTVDRKKLVGSAQARRKEGVLQHGTLPLYGDLARITEALVFPDQASRQRAATRLLERASTVEKALGRIVTWEEAARAFVAAFSEVLKLDLQPGELSSQEAARADVLVREKYGHPDWTGKV